MTIIEQIFVVLRKKKEETRALYDRPLFWV
jgi:hypothetical protein